MTFNIRTFYAIGVASDEKFSQDLAIKEARNNSRGEEIRSIVDKTPLRGTGQDSHLVVQENKKRQHYFPSWSITLMTLGVT